MPVPVFSLFLTFTKMNIKRSLNGIKLYDDFSWTRRHPWYLGRGSEEPRGGHKPLSCALGGWARPHGLWASRSTPNPNLSSINTQIFPAYQEAHQKYFFAAASFCSREIPSWGLFRHSAGGGFDHRGPLHQPCSPSDDAWVVYQRPKGP